MIEKRSSINELVEKWGNSVSIALLDPQCEIFRIPEVDGVIGYRTEAGCLVVLSDPVCAPKDVATLALAFHHYSQEKGIPAVYVAASEKFAKWAMNQVCVGLIEIGEELSVDPQVDPKIGSKGRLLRSKENRAHHAGITVHEYRAQDSQLKQDLQQVVNAWLKSRHGPQIFLVHIDLFADGQSKRWFYARQGDAIVGVLSLNRLQARQGWLISHVMTKSGVPNGTSEFLALSVLETLRQENCHFLTFGIEVSGKLGEIKGIGKFYTWFARWVFKITNRIFSFNGRSIFWKKFQPQGEPAYLLFGRKPSGLREVLGIMRAFNVAFK